MFFQMISSIFRGYRKPRLAAPLNLPITSGPMALTLLFKSSLDEGSLNHALEVVDHINAPLDVLKAACMSGECSLQEAVASRLNMPESTPKWLAEAGADSALVEGSIARFLSGDYLPDHFFSVTPPAGSDPRVLVDFVNCLIEAEYWEGVIDVLQMSNLPLGVFAAACQCSAEPLVQMAVVDSANMPESTPKWLAEARADDNLIELARQRIENKSFVPDAFFNQYPTAR